MANWSKIADAMAQGGFGVDIQGERAKRQAMQMEVEKLGLAKNADARAAAGEGREAEANTYGISQRGSKEQQMKAAIESLLLGNTKSKNENDVFTAGGGAEGQIKIRDAEQARKSNEDRRADTRSQIDKETSARQGAEAQRDATMDVERLAGVQRENRIGKATEDARIDKVLDSGDEAILDDLQRQYIALSRTDPEGADHIKEQHTALRAALAEKQLKRKSKRTFGNVKSDSSTNYSGE